jgi:anti-sigma regulatory factor (Ser/Thr protein kinase)
MKQRQYPVKILTIPAELSEIDGVRQFLRDELQGAGISEQNFFKIELAVVEICINVIRYAYPRERGSIHLSLKEGRKRVAVEIRDSGIPFDPCAAPKPDIKEIVEAGRKGGLGIYLTLRLMDTCDYRREDGQNVLTMIKKI